MAREYRRLLSWVAGMPLALLPAKIEAIRTVLSERAGGIGVSAEEIAARIEGAKTDRQIRQMPGSIAVLPLYGVMGQRMDLFMAYSGGTSTDRFARQFRQAVADPNVKAVVIDVDSPGGNVYGVQELGDIIRSEAERGEKKIVAVANSLAASAAYWIASQANELVVTPGGEVGSIGVYTIHEDSSGFWNEVGVNHEVISAGEFKTEWMEFWPLTDEAREALQAKLNEYYDMFVKAVAKGRGVSAGDVRQNYGKGRLLGARRALAAGMVDRIETLDQTLERLGGAAPNSGSGRANADLPGARVAVDDHPEPTATAAEDTPEASGQTQAEMEDVGDPSTAGMSVAAAKRRLKLAELA